jgi:hypothetical protein
MWTQFEAMFRMKVFRRERLPSGGSSPFGPGRIGRMRRRAAILVIFKKLSAWGKAPLILEEAREGEKGRRVEADGACAGLGCASYRVGGTADPLAPLALPGGMA